MLRSAAAPVLAGALALSVTAPAAATPAAPAEEAMPIGNVGVVIAGITFGDFTYPLEAGKRITIQRHVLDPGEVIRWEGPSTVVAMHNNEDGDLTNFPNCTSQQRWRAYPAYYVARSKEANTLTGVTLNSSSVPIEFYTIASEAIGAPQSDGQLHREPTSPQPGEVLAGGAEAAPGEVGDPVTAANGCPSGPEGETTRLAAGKMTSSEQLALSDHTQIVVYRHTVPAGYHSGWYSPYWPSVLIPVSGEISVARDCGDGTALPVGSAARTEGPTLVRSDAAAEYLSVSWNVQNAFPIDVPFYLPEAPPSGCPETALPVS